MLDEKKLIDIENLKIRIGRPVVASSGVFDLLHAGHLHTLCEADKLGWVVLFLDSDDLVKKNKGESRPVNSFYHRKELLLRLPFVHSVIEFNSSEELLGLLKVLSPNYYVKDASYLKDDFLEKETLLGCMTTIVFTSPLSSSTSTTKMIDKVKRE